MGTQIAFVLRGSVEELVSFLREEGIKDNDNLAAIEYHPNIGWYAFYYEDVD